MISAAYPALDVLAGIEMHRIAFAFDKRTFSIRSSTGSPTSTRTPQPKWTCIKTTAA